MTSGHRASSAIARAFMRMWAIAHIVHLAGATDFALDTPWNLGTFVAALVVVAVPDRRRVFAIMVAGQLIDMVVEMPFSPDHWMLMGAINLALLTTFALRRSVEQAALVAALPAARLLLIVGYSAAAIAKYNTTYLDPARSCAVALAEVMTYGLAARVPFDSLWVASSLVLETLIPIFLVIPATRRHGVRIGMVFHFVLSASPAFAVVDFTSTLFALFMLFLADDDHARVVGRLRGWGGRSAIVHDAGNHPLIAASLVLLTLGFSGYVSPQIGAGIVWLLAELYLAAVMLAALVTWRSARGRQVFGRIRWAAIPAVIALAVWVANPYLGFRTSGVLTMFSSLRTEGDQPNHLFLPTHRLVPWQDDLVIMTSSSDPGLRSAIDAEAGVPLIALALRAIDDPGLVVGGELRGSEVLLGFGEGAVPFQTPSAWIRKTQLFRPVPVGNQRFCVNG